MRPVRPCIASRCPLVSGKRVATSAREEELKVLKQLEPSLPPFPFQLQGCDRDR
jgi:hypothetical protein